MKLAIISHTEHYRRDGKIVGWGATVREIDHLCSGFEEIWHVAPLHPEEPPASARPYRSDNVKFIPLIPTGGPGLWDKLGIVKALPGTMHTIWKVLREVDVFQFRAPTGMGVYLLPALTLLTRKKGWFKYAGNWKQARTRSYAWQKWWLTRVNRRPVTINGRWPGQPAHILPFENPCLDRDEREEGRLVVNSKRYHLPLTACFVGRLDASKGVDRIIEALEELQPGVLITMHFVGDGPGRGTYEKRCQALTVNCVFHGFLDRAEVGEIMAESHLLLLPSDSEGFPKVLAEGWNYGCIPVVSDVSAIPQYVNEKSGFLWQKTGRLSFAKILNSIDWTAEEALKNRSGEGFELAERFTFDHYNRRVLQIISEQFNENHLIPRK